MLFKIVLRTCEIIKIHYELIEKEAESKETSEELLEKNKQILMGKKLRIELKKLIIITTNWRNIFRKITILFT